jgi:heptosyltransferase-2
VSIREVPSGRHVVVVQTGFLGDVVLTTPLVSAVRRVLAPRRLSVVVRPEARGLVENHPSVDAVIVDDKRGRDRGARGLARVARRLRAAGVDLAVSPHKSLRTAVLLAAAGVPYRIGFGGTPGAWLYHARVRRDPRLHDAERNLALVSVFGADPREHAAPPRLVAGPAAEARASDLLAACGLDDGRPLYGICPGSAWPTKRWRPEGFGAVARRLATRRAAAVLILGEAGDGSAAAVEREAGGSAVNLAGRTDLATFVALTGRLRLVVANDSAPMHIAAACGVPVVAVFCATSPAQGYGPYGGRAEVVEADLGCRPCARHGGAYCPRGTGDCMWLVRAAEVVVAAERLLASESPRSPRPHACA